MMNGYLYDPVPEELPSPDELFHSDQDIKGPVSVNRQKPIPRYRVVKRVSAGFLIFLAVMVLAVLSLDRLGYHYYYMGSRSMQSSIPEGSFLFEREAVPEELESGDVITYVSRDGKSITHEIIRVIDDYRGTGVPAFRTRGTENRFEDINVVTADMVQGKVIFHIPYLGGILSKLSIR